MLDKSALRRVPAIRRSAARTTEAHGRTGRIPAVDGLRAIAVTGVMAFHFGLGLRGGFLGVDLFFVISGYVITRLLLIEWHGTGRISRRRFWGRRARRLLPAAITVLIVVQLWIRLGAPPDLRTTTNAQTVAALAYVSNWYAIFADVGYWGAAAGATPLAHLWSLAVEEQFYLVWPLLLIAVLALTRSHRAVAAVAGAGAVASYTTSAVLFQADGVNRAYLGTDARSGALLLGVLCALGITRSRPAPDGSWDRALPDRLRAPAAAVFALAAVALAVLWATAAVPAPWLYTGGLAVAGVCAALVIAFIVLAPGSLAARLLAYRPVLWTGRISYSLYLWHWPVRIFAIRLRPEMSRPVLIACEFAASFALATLSYVVIERPTQRIRRAMVLAPALLAGAVAVFGSAALAQPPPPAEEQSGIAVHGPAR